MNTKQALPWAAATLCVAITVSAVAPEPKDNHRPAKPASARLERMKKLAGVWVNTDDKGNPTSEVVSVFKVMSAGTTVVETMFPDSDHEMVSVYHDDGEDLVMTHYCALGNQPRMKAERGGDPNVFSFQCTGNGTNMESENEAHIHAARITILDDDHIESKWTAHENGKPANEPVWKLVRRKG